MMDRPGVLSYEPGFATTRERVPMSSREPEPHADPTRQADTLKLLTQIAAALDRIAPRPPAPPDLAVADAFVWQAAGRRLSPVPKVNRVEMSLLRGIDRLRDTLADNTDASRADCRPTTRSSGARAAWASPRSSRRSTPRSTRASPPRGGVRSNSSRFIARTSRPCPT